MIRSSSGGRLSLRRYLFAFSALALIGALLINSGLIVLPAAHADNSAQSGKQSRFSSARRVSPAISITTLPTTITQNFDTLATAGTANAWADDSTLPGWYAQFSLQPASPTTYRADAGTSNTGAIYSYGTGTNTERAFGSVASGTPGDIFYALKLTNNTGSAITALDINFTGEQWRNGGNTSAQQLDFQYQVASVGTITDANTPTTGWTDFDTLDFVSPVTGATAAALDGNAAANRTAKSGTLNVTINNGEEIWLRFKDTNDAGNDHGLAIDDFSVTAGMGGGPTNPSGIGSANPNPVAPGSSTLLTVTVTPGGNPTSTGLAVTANLTAIGGSATQSLFDDGAHEDGAAGDNVFAFRATVTGATSQGIKSLPISITDAQARMGSTNISLTVQSAAGLAIHDVQGSGTTSPFVSQSVTVSGIVTAVRLNSTGSAANGFFIQTPDASADADPNTSEGIFVFTSSAPPAAVAVGNLITVTGTVSEFIPSGDPSSPPESELVAPLTISLTSTGNPLPAAITLTAADTSPTGSVEQLEKFEGMRVRVNSLTASSPTQGTVDEVNAASNSNGTFYGVITGLARPFREPGIERPDPTPTPIPTPNNIPTFDANPERLRVDTARQTGSTPIELSTGAVVTNLVGPLDYVFRSYTILQDPSPAPGVTGGVGSAIPVPTPSASEFTVASFNMQRFYDTTDDAGTSDVVLTAAALARRLNKASLAIRNVMQTPDIIGVEEMENLSNLQAVATKVNNDAVGAGQPNPSYQAYLSEGNDIGGIDVGFLVKSSRVNVIDVTQFGKDTTYVEPGGATALLNDRPPLVMRATINRPAGGVEPLTVIVNHLRSLTGVDGTDGARIRAKRRAQAEYLANLIQARQVADPTEKIISVGDYNAFQFNDGYVDSIGTIKGTPAPPDQVLLASADLVNPDLTDLVETLPADQRYSFTFDGNAQTLDHELANAQMLTLFNRLVYGRNNGDYPDSLRNDMNRPERISDHDMPVSYFHFTGSGVHQKARADFDGDMKTDLSVTRPISSGPPPIADPLSFERDGIQPSGAIFWFIRNSLSNTNTVRNWGNAATDTVVPGDYDGDGKTDFAVWRMQEGNWYIIQSMTGTGRVEEIGVPGDMPVPADYDGDGKTDVGIWRPSTGGWILRRSSMGGTFRPQVFWGSGSLGDVPVPSDYDGDGKTDIAVFRPSEGNWYILQSMTNTVRIQGWGKSSDKLVPADYDGDGKTDVAVFRPSEGNWYIRNSSTNTVTVRNWGLSTDRLVPGDYDGDGKTDIAVWRPSEGNWYIINSQTNTVTVQTWGQSGDSPVPASYIPQ